MVCEYNEEETIVYIYDANGSPIGFKYRSTWHEEDVWEVYWYEKNLQGDIVSIYDEYGNLLVTYTYNAWGRKGEQYYNGADSTAAVKNNLRYRSYYYDPDLEMYYLQSRYYDYKICRFISPDELSYLGANGGLVGYNLYAYCNNDPVDNTDPTGNIINLLVGAGVGFGVGVILSIASQVLDKNAQNSIGEIDFWKHVAIAGICGAITGALAASGAGVGVQVAVNAITGAASALIDTRIDDDGEVEKKQYLLNALDGAIVGAISGYIGGKGTASKHTSNSFWRLMNGKTNFSYYYSQTMRQSYIDGKKAIPSIIKASVPTVLKILSKFEYQKGVAN